MVTVGSLAYAIVANTTDFTKGVVGTKAELRELKSAFLAGQDPVDKYSSAIAHLEDLAQKFPAKAAGLAPTIAKMRAEMDQAKFASSAFGQVFNRLVPVIDPISAGFQALHTATGLARAGFQSLEAIVGKVADEMQRLDETAKTARNLGVDESSLVGFRRAAADISGVASEEFDKSFLKFGVNIGNAAMHGSDRGTGPAAEALDRLGLDANKLSGMSIDKSLLEVSKALQQIENADERLALSKGLLGKGGERLATMLAAGDQEILKLAADQNALAQTDFINFEAVEKANDAFARLETAIQGIVSLLASDFAPLVEMLAADLVGGFGEAEGSAASFRDTIHELSLALAATIDGLEYMQEWGSKGFFEKMNPMTGSRHQLAVINGVLEGNTKSQASTAEIAAKASEAEERAAKSDADKAEAERMADLERQVHAHLQDVKAEEAARAKEYQAAQQLAESLKTPAEKMADKLADLKEYSDKGLIDAETYGRGLSELKDKAQGMIPSQAEIMPQTVQAVRAGSVEALRAQYSGKGGTPEKQLEVERKALSEAEASRKLLEDIKSAISTTQIAEAV